MLKRTSQLTAMAGVILFLGACTEKDYGVPSVQSVSAFGNNALHYTLIFDKDLRQLQLEQGADARIVIIRDRDGAIQSIAFSYDDEPGTLLGFDVEQTGKLDLFTRKIFDDDFIARLPMPAAWKNREGWKGEFEKSFGGIMARKKKEGALDCSRWRRAGASTSPVTGECLGAICEYLNCKYFEECGGETLVDRKNTMNAICWPTQFGVIYCWNCEE